MGRGTNKKDETSKKIFLKLEESKYRVADHKQEKREMQAEARKRRAAEKKANEAREARIRKQQLEEAEAKRLADQIAVVSAPGVIVDPTPLTMHPAMEEALNDGGKGWIPVRSKQLVGQKGGMIRFHPTGPHRAYILRVNQCLIDDKPCWDVTAKARQQFWSTTCAVLTYCLPKHLDGIAGPVAAHEARAVKTLWEMYRNMRDHDPDLPRERELVGEDGVKRRQKDSAGELMLPNKSRAVVDLAKNTLGKSGSYVFAQLSEADFYEGEGVQINVMWHDFLTTMPDTGFSVLQVESTRDPVHGGWLQQMYEQAQAKKGRFFPRFVPWFTSKGKKFTFDDVAAREEFIKDVSPYEKLVLNAGATYEQLAWARMDLADSGGDRSMWAMQNPAFEQEMFGASRMCAFDTTKLDNHMKTGVSLPRYRYEIDLDRVSMSPSIFDGGPDSRFMVWRHPVGSNFYYVGADSAGGIPSADDDNSEAAIVVLDGTTKEVVARWSGYEQPLKFASIVAAIGMHYNTAFIVPEINNHGHATVSHLAHVLNYPIDRIYHERNETAEVDERKNRIGWHTNQASKIRMVSNARFVIDNETVLLNDAKIVEQARTFVHSKDGVYEKSRRTDKDDVLVAFMLAVSEAIRHHDFGLTSAANAAKLVKQNTPLRLVVDDDKSERRTPVLTRHRFGRRRSQREAAQV